MAKIYYFASALPNLLLLWALAPLFTVGKIKRDFGALLQTEVQSGLRDSLAFALSMLMVLTGIVLLVLALRDKKNVLGLVLSIFISALPLLFLTFPPLLNVVLGFSAVVGR